MQEQEYKDALKWIDNIVDLKTLNKGYAMDKKSKMYQIRTCPKCGGTVNSNSIIYGN